MSNKRRIEIKTTTRVLVDGELTGFEEHHANLPKFERDEEAIAFFAETQDVMERFAASCARLAVWKASLPFRMVHEDPRDELPPEFGEPAADSPKAAADSPMAGDEA